MTETIIWLAIVIIFLVIEGATCELVTAWFAGGAIVAFIASFFGVNLLVQIILFIVVSIILLLLTRPILMKYIKDKQVKTNIYSLAGEKARVTSDIDNYMETGTVIINGLEWTARSVDDSVKFEKGNQVEIVEIQGVKLIVKETKTTEEI
jgi:Membrane protein implicated in regulation of membrane protease activity